MTNHEQAFADDARRLRFAIDVSGLGMWELEINTGMLTWDERCANLFGIAGTGKLSYDEMAGYIHPDDKSRVDDMFMALRTGRNKSPCDIHFRVMHAEGSLRWVRFKAQAFSDNKGMKLGGVAEDLTEVMNTKQEIAEARDGSALKRSEERLKGIIAAAPAGIGLFVGRDLVIQYPNQTFIDIVGKGPGVEGLPLREAMPELITEGQPFLKILDEVFTTGKMFQSFGSQVKIVQNGVMTYNYYNITYTPVFDEQGEVFAILDIAIDVTEQIKAVQELNKARQELELAMNIGGLGNFVIDLRNGIATYSQPIAGWFGLDGEPQQLSGILARIHPDDKKAVASAIDASGAGVNEGRHDMVYRVENPLSRELHYLHSMGQMQFSEGRPVMIAGIIRNVTMEITSTRRLEASENRLRNLVESAPFPIGVFAGKDMRVQMANHAMLEAWGKGRHVTGKKIAEVLPELESQHVFAQLDQVFTTGIPLHIRNQQFHIIVQGSLTTVYYNYSFTPVFDAEGKVYGIMNTAAEVTDLALARERAENMEAVLHSAIELAELGTWSLDTISGQISYSGRVREWFGLSPDQADQYEVYGQIHEKDKERVKTAILQALTLDRGKGGVYDEEYTAIARDTGVERILHAQGKAVFNESGTAIKLSGTLQDVTIYRELQLALQNQVQEQTEELAASNEELRKTNEELALSNRLLLNSNEELGQYAYVASHDLQEPLRKIRVFASKLSKETVLPKELAPLVRKIDSSSQRMSQLIHDLLDFSRLVKSAKLVRPVNLSDVIRNVLNDFELLIEEKGAVIRSGNLPEVQAIALQMNQLFYNLLGNALKFTKNDTPLVISISSEPVSLEEVEKHMPKPLPFAQYFRISVSDNGIGFETQYSEQIFEVFKRLHGQEQYPGSGIGLAMCRRIADNHNGRLYAESKIDEGSVFHLLLPDRQHEQEPELPTGFKWVD